MNVGGMIRCARRRARLTQRELAAATGVAQPTIARLERGGGDPRIGTVERLLNACDDTLASVPRPGLGVDRTAIRELLALDPAERLLTLVEEASFLDSIASARRTA